MKAWTYALVTLTVDDDGSGRMTRHLDAPAFRVIHLPQIHSARDYTLCFSGLIDSQLLEERENSRII